MIQSASRAGFRVPAFVLSISLLASLGCQAQEGSSTPAGEVGTAAAALSPTVAEAAQASEALPDTSPPGRLPPGRPLATPAPAQSQEAPQVVDIASLGFNIGSGKAPVRVMEFADFGCAFCRQFHMETYPYIQEEYINTGKVEWKYIPVVIGRFGPSAELAAEVGECAGEQGNFERTRDRIFQLQPEWQRSPDPMQIFRGIAQEMGLDLGRWEQCVVEGWRDDRVRQGTQLGFRAGLRGTPTFLIVGFTSLPGAIPIELFREVLDSALVVQGGGQGPGL